MELHRFHFQTISLLPLQTQQELSFQDEMEYGWSLNPAGLY